MVFANEASVKLKAGKNVSASVTSSNYTELISQAESYLNTLMRINYTDTFASLNADVKDILEDACSSHAAMAAINYDMSTYTSRAEAQTMLDVNYTRLQDAIKLLKDKKFTDFINDA